MAEVRFQLDEHIANAVAEQLRRRGVDALTAAKAGLRGQPDREYLNRSLATGRVTVTQDHHFLILHRQCVPHAGIVFCQQGRRSIGQIVEQR